jgi:hypothetical protein
VKGSLTPMLWPKEELNSSGQELYIFINALIGILFPLRISTDLFCT